MLCNQPCVHTVIFLNGKFLLSQYNGFMTIRLAILMHWYQLNNYKACSPQFSCTINIIQVMLVAQLRFFSGQNWTCGVPHNAVLDKSPRGIGIKKHLHIYIVSQSVETYWFCTILKYSTILCKAFWTVILVVSSFLLVNSSYA